VGNYFDGFDNCVDYLVLPKKRLLAEMANKMMISTTATKPYRRQPLCNQ
jgi:hypothetical protein